MAVLFLPGGRYTAVADPVSTREVYARSAAMTAVLPILILLPVLVIVIGLTLWRILAPIRSAARAAAERPATDLTPLPSEGVPAEVKPFVEAVNSLLGRVSEARTRELRFTADAAHELRSPLTSLTIEAEHLGRLDLPSNRSRSSCSLHARRRAKHPKFSGATRVPGTSRNFWARFSSP